MPERVEAVPYKQVANAMKLGWAWFYVTIGSGSHDSERVLVRPTMLRSIIVEHMPPAHYYEFEAIGQDGTTYSFKIYLDQESVSHQHENNSTVRITPRSSPPRRRTRNTN